MSEIYNQFRGSGNDRKIKVAVEGIKLTTGLEISTKTSTF